jgi:hypothetical protein
MRAPQTLISSFRRCVVVADLSAIQPRPAPCGRTPESRAFIEIELDTGLRRCDV